MLTEDTFDVAKNVSLSVATEYLENLRARIEDEEEADQNTWQNPDGSHKPLPSLLGDALIYSAGCKILLRTSGLKGLKIEEYNRKSISYTVVIWVTSVIEIILSMQQMQYSITPSALSKVSMVSIGMQTAIDAYMSMMHFAVGATSPPLFLPFIAAAFLKFVLFSIVEIRYMLEILRAQRNSDDAYDRIRYNYHPILDHANGNSIGDVEKDVRKSNGEPNASQDCAICFAKVVQFSPLISAQVLRRSYMLTPCTHLFHTDCLKKWMEVKFECPVCRAELPPPGLQALLEAPARLPPPALVPAPNAVRVIHLDLTDDAGDDAGDAPDSRQRMHVAVMTDATLRLTPLDATTSRDAENGVITHALARVLMDESREGVVTVDAGETRIVVQMPRDPRLSEAWRAIVAFVVSVKDERAKLGGEMEALRAECGMLVQGLEELTAVASAAEEQEGDCRADVVTRTPTRDFTPPASRLRPPSALGRASSTPTMLPPPLPTRLAMPVRRIPTPTNGGAAAGSRSSTPTAARDGRASPCVTEPSRLPTPASRSPSRAGNEPVNHTTTTLQVPSASTQPLPRASSSSPKPPMPAMTNGSSRIPAVPRKQPDGRFLMGTRDRNVRGADERNAPSHSGNGGGSAAAKVMNGGGSAAAKSGGSSMLMTLRRTVGKTTSASSLTSSNSSGKTTPPEGSEQKQSSAKSAASMLMAMMSPRRRG
ncbi:hypothetical protein HK101_008321 [Irineochytrium annulatum]|nr:hypothetical protein HK101_008321 [Irineochytrium annulatum]